MLVFGHIGVSLALLNGVEATVFKKLNFKKRLIDYRVVAVGVILPDLIDKPLVQLIYGLDHHEGHYIAHSPWFALCLVLIGLICFLIKGRDKFKLILLGLCCFLHQFEDFLMHLQIDGRISNFLNRHHLTPGNLGVIDRVMGPIYKHSPYLSDIRMFLLEPYVFIVELFGFIYILYFLLKRFDYIKKH